MSTTIEMTFVKSTKGTYVYGDSSPNAAVPTLYIKKDALPPTPPNNIKLIIEHDDKT